MALEIAPTPAGLALPPLQPPRPGDPDDSDALHAALLEGVGGQARDGGPDLPPDHSVILQCATRDAVLARLRTDPHWVALATVHTARLVPVIHHLLPVWDPVATWATVLM